MFQAIYSVLRIIIFLMLLTTAGFSADIIPADFAGPAQPSLSESYLIGDAVIDDYAELIRQIHSEDPLVPASVLGAVRIAAPAEALNLTVRIFLIRPMPPGTVLQIVIPNKTGVSWSTSGSDAIVGSSGLSAVFAAEKPGFYAVYNPERASYLSTLVQNRRSLSDNAYAEQSGQNWGLFSENAPSPAKIPLILVHGDNSYKEKKDRWDYFLDWASDHPEFDAAYEIWRFHHDTSALIGYDGKSGNSLELGDAIMKQFGPARPVLLLAHSRGGLVSRAYMCRYGQGNEGDRVLGLITLGTPHHGSPGAVPDWGLETVKSHFMDTVLSGILYGFSEDAVVNVSDIGTMGLAWDNFDGPENGIPPQSFSLKSKIGTEHVLSLMDANITESSTDHNITDPTIYIPDRSFGTLAGLNSDARYYGKIIAYAGYSAKLGIAAANPVNWMNLSFSNHAGLEIAAHIMANTRSKRASDGAAEYLFMANDGMVPLQSALLLKADRGNEPFYEASEDGVSVFKSLNVNLKNFSHRLVFKKNVVCPDYDHLDLAEGKGGVFSDRNEYWNHVASDLNELSRFGGDPQHTPVFQTFSGSKPSFETLTSGANCFIGTAATE